MDNLIQIQEQLKLTSTSLENVVITQQDKNMVWAKGIRFGKHEVKFTVALTAGGKVKKHSVRFCD